MNEHTANDQAVQDYLTKGSGRAYAERGGDIRWTPKEARALLSQAEVRLGEKEQWGGVGLEALIEGEWLPVCRTDLKDNVVTSWVHPEGADPEAIRAEYIGCIRYGARYCAPTEGHKGYFAGIDSLSDG
jgi:hypothetical protein